MRLSLFKFLAFGYLLLALRAVLGLL